jgi:ribonuclease III
VKQDSALVVLQNELGYTFRNPSLLVRALTHISADRAKDGAHNEVLEFLGDAVLDLAVSDLLIRRYPARTEGDLSRMRAALVNSPALAQKAMLLRLGSLLRLGKGEERSDGRNKPSILAGAFEALLGAIYEDGGYEPCRRLVDTYFSTDIHDKKLGQQDYKTRLQEISQMLFRETPAYRIVGESGPDHDKHFVTEIAVAGKVLGRGRGKTKKQSEQQAAARALAELQQSGSTAKE